jgi:plastocyanin
MAPIATWFSRTTAAAAAAIALVSLPSCGGSSPNGPSGVTVVVRDGGATTNSGATVTITASGVSPKSVTVAVGQGVTFVNSDSRQHEIASNPHPQHGSCPSIEGALGTLSPGQSRITHAFANAGSCGYHDHLDDSNTALQGTIIVQ